MLFFGQTDIGKKRSTNQDSFYAARLSDHAVLCVVCDGMGGTAGGNIASETAVQVFSEYIAPRYEAELASKTAKGEAVKGIAALLCSAAGEANSAVYEKAKETPVLKGMGTTLCAAFIVGSILYVANIGDSRLYVITDHDIQQITRDHSFVQYLVDIGQLTPEEAAVSPHRNIITRAIGNEGSVETDIFTLNLGNLGHCYILLCSDGLSNYLSRDELRRIIMKNIPGAKGEDELREKANLLIASANQAGGADNITTVLIKY